MNGIGKAITLWGVLVLLGFGAFQFYVPGNAGAFYSTAVYAWIVLALVGFAGMAKFVDAWLSNDTVKVWLVLVTLGVVVTFLQVFTGLIPVFMPYLQYWLMLIGVGYLLTGYTWHKHIYYGAGVLQFVLMGLLWAKVEPFQTGQYLASALVAGAPALYDGLTGYN